jgi:molybdopterin adenylyltransferase
VKVAVLTISDRCARGERDDEGGPLVERLVVAAGAEVVARAIVPDERVEIEQMLRKWSDAGAIDLVLTTGGTGLGARDVTPEATRSVIDREAPGIAEAMRHAGMQATAMAALSRQVAGARGKTLIVNLPGSPKAVAECLDAVIGILPHAVEMMNG